METQPAGEMISLFVPGRICLFGEHSDWAGMYRCCAIIDIGQKEKKVER